MNISVLIWIIIIILMTTGHFYSRTVIFLYLFPHQSPNSLETSSFPATTPKNPTIQTTHQKTSILPMKSTKSRSHPKSITSDYFCRHVNHLKPL